jgi:hypothetical protein
MINFCYDELSTPNIGYPNLATLKAVPYTPSWRKFDSQWPYTVPLRLLYYFHCYKIPYNVHLVSSAPQGSVYPISIGWFDFQCDYFSLIPVNTLKKIKDKEIHVLFYYHEGDNPTRITQRLDNLCHRHNIDIKCYTFISANSAAENYFSDHEFFFRYINRDQVAVPITTEKRQYTFTALCRTHKWWRATCLADLERKGLLENSLWSYNTKCVIDDNFDDNPIQIDHIEIRNELDFFINNGPYSCDDQSEKEHNDHHIVNASLYTQSYIHIILETHFDADQSGGTFLTEKTWKAIKFGQPFIIVGPPNSLATLRERGYKTFDHCINNKYDSIQDNTNRWMAIVDTLTQLNSNPELIYQQCIEDVRHNQRLFLSTGHEELNRIIGKLNV